MDLTYPLHGRTRERIAHKTRMEHMIHIPLHPRKEGVVAEHTGEHGAVGKHIASQNRELVLGPQEVSLHS